MIPNEDFPHIHHINLYGEQGQAAAQKQPRGQGRSQAQGLLTSYSLPELESLIQKLGSS